MKNKISSIAIFTWGLSGGAITNIAAALANGFSALGIENIYILYIYDVPEKRANFPPRAQLINLKVKRTRQTPIPIAKFLKQVQPDFLISLGFLNFPAILGWLLAGKILTKLVISQQNSLIYQVKVENQPSPLFKIQLKLASWLYPKVNGLVATTDAVLQEVTNQIGINLSPQKTTVIPNIVDIEFIRTQAKTEPVHPWLSTKQSPIIISIGRLAKQKNFLLLLQALKIVKQKLDLKLIILGEGSERKTLEAAISQLNLDDCVSLPGFDSNPWSSLAQADLFVLPSEEEAFGLVIVEAMACGIPAIATDAMGEGPRTILDNGEYGCLVPNQNAKALAEGIIQVMTCQDLKNSLIAAGKKRCQAFSRQIIAQKWLSFLRSLD